MDHKSSYKKVKHLEKKYSPLLTKPHKDLRLKWAKDHMTWNEAWHNVYVCMYVCMYLYPYQTWFRVKTKKLYKKEKFTQKDILKVISLFGS